VKEVAVMIPEVFTLELDANVVAVVAASAVPVTFPVTLPVKSPVKLVAVITPEVLIEPSPVNPRATVASLALDAVPVKLPTKPLVAEIADAPIIPVVLILISPGKLVAVVAVVAVPVTLPVKFPVKVVAVTEAAVMIPEVFTLELDANVVAVVAVVAVPVTLPVRLPVKLDAVIAPEVLIEPSPVNPRATVATFALVAVDIVPSKLEAVTTPVARLSPELLKVLLPTKKPESVTLTPDPT